MGKMSEQRKLHKPIIKWLELKGCKVLPESEKITVLIRDIFPAHNYIQPDIIGIKDILDVVVVEVETKLEKIFDI